ncbi:MAG: M23 family metallopeptidase [Anaerolineae bacterium]|nr:M23 family metallopeptidase [Anaerolineae bacterium]
MRQPGEIFIPRRKTLLAGTTLKSVFERYLTLISIAVTFIGIVLVVIGPVRAVLGSGDSLAADGNTPSTGPSTVGMASLSGVGLLDPVEFSRPMVAFTIIPERPRRSVGSYTVQAGDTLFAIAHRFSIDPKTIFWSNAVLEDDVHLLQPGMELAIPPEDGVFYTADGASTLQWAADYYKGDVNAIIDSPYNELAGYTSTDVPPWGMKILVPGGERELIWKNPVVQTTDKVTGKVMTGFMPGMGGSCPSGTSGGGGSGSFVRPVNDYMVTQTFGPGHSGIDLGAPVGTPVYAADSGVVIFSGWNNWGYGILVVLDHSGPGGWTSYYAHLNSKAVGCGQMVSRGQYIGQVGSTGNSSGAHLHFELRWNHAPSNPAGMIGF